MTTFTWNNVLYDNADLTKNDNTGYAEKIVPGVGGAAVERFIAMMMDGLADAGKQLVTSSATSVTIGTGSKGPFTMATTIPYTVGSWVLAASASAPTTKWLLGQVTARSGNLLTLNIPTANHAVGSGAVTDWVISASGPLGPTGATSPPDINGMTTETVPLGTDYFPMYDVSLAANRKVLLSDIQKNIYSAVAGNGYILSQMPLKACSEVGYNKGNISGAVTLDYNNGNWQNATLTGNVTSLTVSNWPGFAGAGLLTINLVQDATGGRSLALGAAYKTVNGAGVLIGTGANDKSLMHLISPDAGTTIFAMFNMDFS